MISLVLFTVSFITIIGFLPGCNLTRGIEWESPYQEIDWDNIIRARAQFHTHSTHSDGYFSPHYVVDLYHELGYDILAVTDHWKTTWPWTEFSSFEASGRTYRRLEEGDLNGLPHEDVFVFEDRDPDALGILAIRGSEPSHVGPRQHHMVSLFSDVTGDQMDFEETLSAAGHAGGLLSFAHPARATERNNNELDDYIHYFENYPHIYGIDIFTRATFNQPERWPISKELMAGLLNHFGSPDDTGWRPVWMTATDDLHGIGDLDRTCQIQLVEAVTEENVYNSLKNGTFFWVAKAFERESPVIESIEFRRGRIKINGSGFDKVYWYFDNQIIHSGETFNLTKHGPDELFYVYFIAQTSDFSIEEGTGAMLGSQPFWVVRR